MVPVFCGAEQLAERCDLHREIALLDGRLRPRDVEQAGFVDNAPRRTQEGLQEEQSFVANGDRVAAA
ncbi:MAG TPA: hypothetical protein VFE89_13825 [Beijerinckiaceae bacterium]|nr:hypothetical protein [Beijerinckiaceae bacterium]